jgi:hypothetical protein
VIILNVKLVLNGEECGEFPYDSIPALQYYCAENNLKFNLTEHTQTVDISSSLIGKKVWLNVQNDTFPVKDRLSEFVDTYLLPYGISVLTDAGKNLNKKEGDLYLEVSLSKAERVKPAINIGLNSKLNSIDYSKILNIYKDHIVFNGYKLLSDTGQVPHLKCTVQLSDTNDELLKQLGFLLTNCVIKSFIQNRTAHQLDLNLSSLFSEEAMKKPNNPLNHEKEKVLDKKEVEVSESEYEQAKIRRKNKMNPPKQPQAEVYFDFNLMPNRKTEKYSIKADFIIKNTGNTILYNPKICFRVNPAEKIEIGGQILPPEMSEIFSVQGETGAEGWKYSGKDWLEKAYATGEYWIEPIQGLEIHPAETTGIEGIHFTLENLNEQEVSTIIGFVYFEEGNFQLSSNNKIMITF